MLSLLLFSLLSTPEAPVLVPVEPTGSEVRADAPIRLWLSSSRQYREGERARIQVETNDDGYLLVFNYDTDGRLRVIFPIDPSDDNFVRGGRRYEIRGRGDRESFIVGAAGDGLVYAAVSADPFRIDGLETGGNWDYARVAIDRESDDPEADITELVQDVSSNRGFDYDVLTYTVYGERDRYVVATTAWYPRPYGYYDDYYYCDPFYRPSLFGCRYSPGGWYGGWYSGYGRYGYGYGSYYPWYRDRYVYYGGNSRPRNYPIVTGRPRGYTIVRRGSGGSRPGSGSVARPSSGSFGGSMPGGVGSRPRAERPRDPGTRPGGDRVNVPARGGSTESPGVSRPRGRRATPPDAQDRRPTIERERPGERGRVDFGGNRPSVVPDAPRRVETPARRAGGERRAEPREERRVEPRSVSRPRAEPSRPRSEPRASSPRSEPSRRASPPPRSEPSRPSARASEPKRESPKSSGSGSSRPRPRGNGNR